MVIFSYVSLPEGIPNLFESDDSCEPWGHDLVPEFVDLEAAAFHFNPLHFSCGKPKNKASLG
jgi:hypothetical protein